MNFQQLSDLFPLLALAIALLVFTAIVLKLWRSRSATRQPAQPELGIDIAAIGLAAPPQGPYRLELYGTPVLLRVVVIAPSGRQQASLHPDDIPILLNQFMPNLSEICSRHQPVCRCWPSQLSSQGFSQSFFNHVCLPGNQGKGTPWTSLTGKFSVGGQAFLVGLVCCATTPNSLGQFIIEHEGQWFDTLRIRQESS